MNDRIRPSVSGVEGTKRVRGGGVRSFIHSSLCNVSQSRGTEVLFLNKREREEVYTYDKLDKHPPGYLRITPMTEWATSRAALFAHVCTAFSVCCQQKFLARVLRTTTPSYTSGTIRQERDISMSPPISLPWWSIYPKKELIGGGDL